MVFQYSYLFGSLIIALFWCAPFLLRTDLRKLQLKGSFFGLFFGFTESWFIPDYWSPPSSLFGFIENFGFGIESLLVGFFVGGLATVTYYFFLNKEVTNYSLRFGSTSIIVALSLFYFLELVSPTTTIYNLIAVFLSLAFVKVILRFEIAKRVVVGGLIFAVLYTFMFHLFILIFPTYVPMAYQASYWMIYPSGLPLEETFFGFSVGCFWSSVLDPS